MNNFTPRAQQVLALARKEADRFRHNYVGTEHILLGGAPRAIAILNGTLAGAVGLGLRLWLVGIAIWAIGHMTAVWAAKRDPLFVDVVRQHLRIPAHLTV